MVVIGSTHDLCSLVTKKPGGAPVPRANSAVERFAHDRIVGRIDDCCQKCSFNSTSRLSSAQRLIDAQMDSDPHRGLFASPNSYHVDSKVNWPPIASRILKRAGSEYSAAVKP